MMAAREKRAARQRALLDLHGASVICLTLNIAGPVKVTQIIASGIDEAVQRVEEQLSRYNILMHAQECVKEATGLEAYWSVNADSAYLKQLLCTVEEADRFGRLLDIDVIAPDGKKVCRTDIGLPPRRCLLCEQEASICARSRAHTVEMLFSEAEAIILDTLATQYADRIAGFAQKALLYEAACSPKPGLVDRYGSGSHKDMDFFTFLSSASVLTPFFRDCVRIGMRELTPQNVFKALRYHGMCAESAMLRATGEVNTHKGAIFSLGILCGALGYRYTQALPNNVEALCALCMEMTSEALSAEINMIKGPTGARGEAAEGFPSVRTVGLPALKQRIAIGENLNDAGIYALITLIACVADANIHRRGGLTNVKKVMKAAKAILNDYSLDKVHAFANNLVNEGLSPGGCADLLALTYFLFFLED